MPDSAAKVRDQQTSYDLHEDPLPDAEALFITDLPSDPCFHGYQRSGEALLDAFSSLNEQIADTLVWQEEPYFNEASDVMSSASQMEQSSVKSILKKSRAVSATDQSHSKQHKSRVRSANSAKDSRYLMINNSLPQTGYDAFSASNAESEGDAGGTPSIQMEPVVFSCKTGKQIGGFIDEGKVAK